MNLLPDIKKILYCTRIGPNSAYIYRHAMALAEKFDAAITVLHVMETLTPDQEARINGYIGPDSIHDVVEHEEKDALVRIKQHLNSFCSRLGEENSCSLRVEKILVAESSSPADEIVKQSVTMGADVIVIGAHAHSSIMETLLGSTTQKVIRKSAIPVLVVQVPAGEQEFTSAGI
ncbi:MAG: universal stress protein [Desulfobulbales bacterium]|jgi:nucleotide-binding universal stress UspA family protein|nr:universal stress protein [Desulfobulbaceae bacterium]HKJ13859.1 universal stress protein [Desulfobulbales bacterium]MDH3542540.1 universal stress protein [Desulfobulbaceae bacterium]MDH3782840.1 universal stress protein [Desulfobulbaceae bacterium]MDH3866949.1 universal stress protein [Desulfobulbaceae bacterium]